MSIYTGICALVALGWFSVWLILGTMNFIGGGTGKVYFNFSGWMTPLCAVIAVSALVGTVLQLTELV